MKLKNKIRRQQLAYRKRKIRRRLDTSSSEDRGRPMFAPANIHFELCERNQAITCGGIGAMQGLAEHLDLVDAIDRHLHVLRIHKPYHESDHVLNIAYNTLTGGSCLEDIELHRNDTVFLDALGTERIPDPTTAGDFCRRFSRVQIDQLFEAFDETRLKVWEKQPAEFFQQAIIDMDGTLVGTTGECKEGMDISYKGIWGYHPLLVSLANTGEVLRIHNRPGNRPSHEGAAEVADQVIALCRGAGFAKILLRGDTDFTQTAHLDGWDQDGVRFIFGVDVTAKMHILADDLPGNPWKELERPPRYQVKTKRRRRPRKVKKHIVRAREFKNIRLESEWVAETTYRPGKCKRAYRLIIVRKDLAVEKGKLRLFDDYRYFMYITNDWKTPMEEIVFLANDRCHQENLIEQLKNAVGSLRAPLDNLESNWAYMVMTSLGWNLKAWWALCLPEEGRWAEKHQEEKQRVLRMEFKRFVQSFINIPCQIVRTGRRLVYRILSWNPELPIFSRLLTVLQE